MNFIKIYAFFLLSITSYNFGMTGNINTPSSLTVLSEKESEKLFTRLNSSLPQSSQKTKKAKLVYHFYNYAKTFYCNHPDCTEKGNNAAYTGHKQYYSHFKDEHPNSPVRYCTVLNCSVSTQTAQQMSGHTREKHKNI
ncbi:MAG: hypothetical protein WC707_03570 [Candidatus Babeliaceae bacterium]|jgi:hypothetical protein